MTDDDEDICRVCRSPALADRPLFRPCICAGSIRHVHQDCLTQWLRHSHKDYCELCQHKYCFKPIYSPDMPSRLPLKDLFTGLSRSIWSAVKCWIHYTVVAIAWLVIVPLAAARIFNCIFARSVQVLLLLPTNMFSLKSLGTDIMAGVLVLTCTFGLFMCLVFLRLQILNGDVPAWLHLRVPAQLQAEDAAGDQVNANVDNNNNNNDDMVDAGGVHEDVAGDNNIDLQAPQENNELLEEAPLDNVLNWNAIDWEGGPNEPTWERILGLDGSLQFIEHIFWVIALNTLFVLLFAFCPYHLGYLFLMWLDLRDYVIATKLEGIVTTVCGYVLIAFGFLIGHTLFKLLKFRYAVQICGLCYLVLKVGLLIFIDLGLFPLTCGVWLDLCTLKMFNTTLGNRKEGFLLSPIYSMVSHYLVGMLFIFYFATFVILFRSCVRPGVLWFYSNLGNPDFNPIREIIHLPIHKHVKRFALSAVIFGSTIVLVAWLPVQLLLYVAPGFLPFHKGSELISPAGDYPLQVMIFQFALPGVLEHGYLKNHVKKGIRFWCELVSDVLGIRSYLIGDHEENQAEEMYYRYVPYTKPSFFPLRLLMLIVLLCSTIVVTSAFVMYLPIQLGRTFFVLLFNSNGPIPLVNDKHKDTYELYTLALGVWLCWLCTRLVGVLSRLAPHGWNMIQKFVKEIFTTVWKSLALSVFIVAILPLQLGLLFDLVAVIPLRVPLHQTPIIFVWQDWALGIFLFKIISVSVLMGPDNWLKRNVDNAYHQGFQRLQVWKFIQENLLVIVKWLAVVLVVPYVVGRGMPLLLDCDVTMTYLLHWRSYPTIVIGAAIVAFCWFEMRQFGRLCDRIKNERYLIGKTLVDYDAERQSTAG